MGIEARIGAGEWDMLFCQDCHNGWSDSDIDPTWTDDPEEGEVRCPACGSANVIREERG